MFLRVTMIHSLLVILCSVLIFGEAAFVDTLNKCSIKDGDCIKRTLQTVIKENGKTGIPELNIPPFDPAEIRNASIPIPNVADLSLANAVVKGMRNSIVNSFSTDVEKGHATLDITCDLTIKGHYTAFSNSPLLQSIFGQSESLHGDGNAKVKIEKLNIKVDINYYIQQRDGNTYIKSKEGKLQYKYQIGKMSFAADNLFVGKQDASKIITNMLNQNWKLIVNSVGKQFMERAMNRITVFLKKFFDNVPTANYIIEDLTPYATN